MVKFLLSFLTVLCIPSTANAQDYTSSSIFAHNDYVHPVPFYTSYQEQIGFIEADVFLQLDELMVAHSKSEIKQGRTLEELYLKPLQEKIKENEGFAYADHAKSLTLMIDLKTEGIATLTRLVTILKQFPQLLACSTFQIAISGNVPDPSLWNNYPDFIHFDGRPGITYTDDQLKRIILISTNFRSHAQWDGKGIIPPSEQGKIATLIASVHARNKKIRFWNAPDFANGWSTWMEMKVDIIGTDDILGLSAFIKSK